MRTQTDNQEKIKRIVLVSCVVFAVILIISLIVSLISLSTASARKNRLQRELAELNAQAELNASQLAYYGSDEYIERIAREYLNMQGKDEIAFVGK